MRGLSLSSVAHVATGAFGREIGLIAFSVVAIAAFSSVSDQFFSTASLNAVLVNSSVAVVVGSGMAALIIAREIDLSVGSIVAVSAYGAGVVLEAGHGVLLALIISVLLGVLLGATNGLLVTGLRIPSIIATLATFAIFRGLLLIVAPHLIGPLINASQMPPEFRGLARQAFFGVTIPVVSAAAVAIVVGLMMGYSRWGRGLYAIGSNPTHARAAGLRPLLSTFMAFTLVGALTGFAGFLVLMRFASVGVRTGLGLEFTVIAGVVVGGVAIFGGSGRVFGAVLGILLITTLGRGFVLLSIPEFWKTVAIGAAIIVAVVTDVAIEHHNEERLRRSRRGILATTDAAQR